MNKSLSIAEHIIYSTMNITCSYQGEIIGSGTGFFMDLSDGHYTMPALITNKHVIDKADQINIICRLRDDQNESSVKLVSIDINLIDVVANHPDESIDLCAISIGSILKHALDQNTPIFYAPITMDMIPEDDDWQYFDAIEEVTMVGCPDGLLDTVNNFPIVRQGITATSPNIPYRGKQEFMIDMACFPGSSGSPVFLYNRDGYFDRKTGSLRMGQPRIKLLGILYWGPMLKNFGKIILDKDESKDTHFEIDSMMHLGLAIRSSELKVLQSHIFNMIEDNNIEL